MGLGAGAVLPMLVGGGPSPTEAAYDQLRAAVGDGGSARDDTGIEGLWRWSEAKGLAVGASAEVRALLQFDPRLATDHLPYYERVLQEVPPYGASLADRAAVVGERWFEQAVGSTPDLVEELEKIDSRLALLELPQVHAIATKFGRDFEAHDTAVEGPPFNYFTGAKHVWGPNYNTHMVARVRFTLGYPGAPTPSDKLIITRVMAMLRRVLPSDTDFRISTGPWVLGVTPIGLGEVA